MPSLIPTPAKPMPSPLAFVLAAMSWYRASSRRAIPEPSSITVRVEAEGSGSRRTLPAPESREFATISVTIVSSSDPG